MYVNFIFIFPRLNRHITIDNPLYCCIFGFPKYTHSVCWWRLAISAGGTLICMSGDVERVMLLNGCA